MAKIPTMTLSNPTGCKAEQIFSQLPNVPDAAKEARGRELGLEANPQADEDLVKEITTQEIKKPEPRQHRLSWAADFHRTGRSLQWGRFLARRYGSQLRGQHNEANPEIAYGIFVKLCPAERSDRTGGTDCA